MSSNRDSGSVLGAILVVIIAALVVLAFLYGVYWVWSLQTVGEGEVGVVTERGHATGEIYEPGWHHHFPITHTTHTIDTRPQTIDMEGENAIYVITHDGQDVWVDVTVRYRVDSTEAVTFFSEYKSHGQAKERLIYPTVRSDMRDEASDITARDIITQEGRLALEGAVEAALTENAQGSGVVIEAVQIRGVDLNDEFSTQLEQVEIEQVEQERKLIEAETTRQAEIIEAEGAAEAEIIEAEGRAEAMETIDDQLTDGILALEQIDAYDGGTVFVIPADGDTPVILDTGDDDDD